MSKRLPEVAKTAPSGAVKKCRQSDSGKAGVARQARRGTPSPYVVESKRSSVGARHASPVFRPPLGIFSQPLTQAARKRLEPRA